jgi:glucosamine-6-phosphate deaminase
MCSSYSLLKLFKRASVIILCWSISIAAIAYPLYKPRWTRVEQKFLQSSQRKSTYPNEKIAILETRNPFELGKLSALRFIEWVHANPTGVISLSTEKTSEYFIRYLNYYKNNWDSPKVQEELLEYGIDYKTFPKTNDLKFVQAEEFYPISQHHVHNIAQYIKKNYCELLELKPENILLMDVASRGILASKGVNVVFMNGKVNLSKINTKPTTQLDHWQHQALKEALAFCEEYENKIEKFGGIDFYVGSIGFGDNVAYNLRGSSFTSRTRLVKLDYISAAYAAKDLGGIEFSKGKAAITIGLRSITMKPNAVLLTMISGEAKAAVVLHAIESEPTEKYPATIFQKFPNARFYVVTGSTSQLNDRLNETVIANNAKKWNEQDIKSTIIELALSKKKAILNLEADDFNFHARGQHLYNHLTSPLPDVLQHVRMQLIRDVELGLLPGVKDKITIMHTAPHPNDIVLGYYPCVEQLTNHINHFTYITSGYNVVTDEYILSNLRRTSNWWLDKYKISIFNKPYSTIINKFKLHYNKNNIEKLRHITTLLEIKNIKKVFDIKDIHEMKRTIRWLKDDYFASKGPGDKDLPQISLLKGLMRESETQCLWSLSDIPLDNFHFLRAQFYNSNTLASLPSFEDDSQALLEIFQKISPNIITVADDPPGIRPTTNYKAMQVVAIAMSEYIKNARLVKPPKIWCYKNVWFQYPVQDANIFIPVSQEMQSKFQKAFNLGLNSQKDSSFPSPLYEGDFASLTMKIQKDQKSQLMLLLGKEYFDKHPSEELRNSIGFIYMKEMSVTEFINRAENLRAHTETKRVL